jgi:cytochrome c oxidase assembly protein subunit 11
LTKINVNKPKRFFSMSMFYTQQKPPSQAIRNAQISKNNNIIWYVLSGFVIMVGASYAAVPLFKMFCESQGIDANMDFRDMSIDKLKSKLENIKKVENRDIEVKFLASTATDLLWTFEPSQNSVTVAPGETALAFFKAKNLTNRPIIGIGRSN